MATPKKYTLPLKSLGSLRNVLVFDRKAHFFRPLKSHQIDQKYCVDIVNVVNDYCCWKRLITKGIST
jgi:hypothetical protein